MVDQVSVPAAAAASRVLALATEGVSHLQMVLVIPAAVTAGIPAGGGLAGAGRYCPRSGMLLGPSDSWPGPRGSTYKLTFATGGPWKPFPVASGAWWRSPARTTGCASMPPPCQAIRWRSTHSTSTTTPWRPAPNRHQPVLGSYQPGPARNPTSRSPLRPFRGLDGERRSA